MVCLQIFGVPSGPSIDTLDMHEISRFNIPLKSILVPAASVILIRPIVVSLPGVFLPIVGILLQHLVRRISLGVNLNLKKKIEVERNHVRSRFDFLSD